MPLKTDLENIVEGKNDTTNFDAQLMRIVFKADIIRKAKLHSVFPNLVRTVQAFMDTGEKLDLPYDGLVEGKTGKLSCGCEIRAGEPLSAFVVKAHYKHTFEAILFWEIIHRKDQPQANAHMKLSEARIDFFYALDTLYPEARGD